MAFGLGFRILKRLCADQSQLAWQKAKLSPKLFKAHEVEAFAWIDDHLKKHHVLPQVSTLESQFPDLQPVETPEPSSYYLAQLENRFCYDRLSGIIQNSSEIFKADHDAHEPVIELFRSGMREITEQKYRLRILDVKKEAGPLVISAYHKLQNSEFVGGFGWPYLDNQSGGVMPGDVISFVGRPGVGKTWLTLWTALHNWRKTNLNVLFVSMEMTTLPITQRITAMYAKQNVHQLKIGGYSKQTLQKFYQSMKALVLEKSNFYVIDGNLAANVEEIFSLSETLGCQVILIDGAYLLRHKNSRLDRFTRAAENVELIKRFSTDTEKMTFCSWQFNREASKKHKKGAEKADLEDIGYSDAIGQISSIVLSLYQEESVETMKERKVQIIKGRNGEVGQFSIAWNFNVMDFTQCYPLVSTETTEHQEPEQLGWV